MADPVSVAAAALGFAEIALRGVKLISAVRSARENIESLKLQLNESELILSLVKHCLDVRSRIPRDDTNERFDQENGAIASVLQETGKCCEGIQRILADKCMEREVTMPKVVFYKGQWLCHRNRLERMRKELQGHIQSLMAIVQAIHTADNYLSQFDLSQVSLVPNTRNKFPMKNEKLEWQYSLDRTVGLERRPHQYNERTALASLQPCHLRSDLPLEVLFPAGLSYTCHGGCDCACHQLSSCKGRDVNFLLGTLNIECKGIWTPYCTKSSCKRISAKKTLTAKFYTPWLWQRWIQATLSLNPLVGMQFALRTPRVVDLYSPAMDYASYGNVQGLKDLFRQKLASPRDWCSYPIDDVDGRTLISQAIGMMNHDGEASQIKVVQFLVQAGADIHDESCQRAALYVLQSCRVASEEALFLLRKIVKSGDILDDDGLGDLHRVLLGLEGTETTLERELENSESVDARSTNLRPWSALDYAVQNGDLSLLRRLLNHGARAYFSPWWQPVLTWHHGRPAIRNWHKIIQELLQHGATTDGIPLFQIMDSASADTVRLLVSHNLDINQKRFHGQTALHMAVGLHNEAATRVLLTCKARVDIYDNDQNTALHVAAQKGFAEGVRLLLHHGADINLIGNAGHTPLHLAAKWSHLAALRMLRDYEADIHDRSDNSNETPLHCAASQINDVYRGFAPKFDVIHCLLDAGADANTPRTSGQLPFDCIGRHLGMTEMIGCVAAFLSHNVSFSCLQILLTIETKNPEALRLLLARKDLYDLNNFSEDQERVYEYAAKFADNQVLELLSSEKWRGSSAWFGTRTRKTHYQEHCYFTLTNWQENSEKYQEAFAALQNKIRDVAFTACGFENQTSTNFSGIDPEICRSNYLHILQNLDYRAVEEHRLHGNKDLNEFRRGKLYSMVDPITLEHNVMLRNEDYSQATEQGGGDLPVTGWENMSESIKSNQCWLKCSCGLFIYQRDETLRWKRCREEPD